MKYVIALLLLATSPCFAQPYNPVTAPPYNAVCNGVVDDSAAIQAAINALPAYGGVIDFPPTGLCAHSVPLNWKGHNQLKVRGYTPQNGGPATNVSGMLYTGGAANEAHDFRDAQAVEVTGLELLYNNAAFTGWIVNAGGTTASSVSALTKFIKIVFGPSGTARTAGCLNIDQAIEVLVAESTLSGCKIAIRGQQKQSYSNVVTIRNNQFANGVGPYQILGCGDAWRVIGNTFEADYLGRPNGFANNPTYKCRGMLWQGNWFGDVTASGAGWFAIVGAEGFVFEGNTMYGSTADVAFQLSGGKGYVFRGNYFENHAYLIYCNPTPDSVEIAYNSLHSVTTTVGNAAACTHLDTSKQF